MAHNIGGFFKYLAALLMFVFSISLSYAFFSSIAPSDMPWFVWAAMGLTEFGLLCWLAVFMLQQHHDGHKTIALIMIFVCLFAVLFTDAVELARLFHASLIVAQLYYYGLIAVFAAHLLAFVSDFFVGYFSRYPFYSHRGNLIPLQQGNGNSTRVEQIQRGETASPLALPQPKEGNLQRMTLEQVGTVAKEAVSSAMKKGKSFIKSGKKPENAPGTMSATTSENSSQEESDNEWVRLGVQN